MTTADFIMAAALDTNAALEQLLPPAEGPESPLYEAMAYSALAGGKRLRPALFLATAELFGLNRQDCLAWAAALEMIHTYSLIHDDLPGMDNDDFRRGRPACHKAYGEAMAILAGDALLTQAFCLLSRPLPNIGPGRQLRALGLVAAQAGGMVAGQAAEFALAGGEIGLAELKYIYARKTGALFQAAVLSAALLAGAEAAALTALADFCYHLGLAFQISDDALDVAGSAEDLGKPIGSDARNQKATYAALLGCGQAWQAARDEAGLAVAALADFGKEADLLRGFPALFSERRK